MRTEQTGFHQIDDKTRERKLVRLTLLAGSLFFLGFITVITGFLLTIAHAIIPNDVTLNALGTFLIFISIPLLLAGSYFLDMNDK